ncbi:hypothetical protein M409DRAFT_27704 [Zasmidium cellare ATCC 36951]|uniref:RING-type domain-containing protein n=1 Tax=Zasmidium cellare ATCC 36951 TaxID=1080233 RepID=A0A6A6C6T7_ZASCE|nr:uncharacterized protein M409DRAFT_27704 [Zasmidium cellare ATCC 36951]KAF2161978.1 hypothetical protein M409DRAFT_27704 [Zasmidium cellare ATCC 36951]
MVGQLAPHRGADALPVDCVCEECLELQREYCHVLNLVEQYQVRPKIDRRLGVAAGQLYEAWLEAQHSQEHEFVARQKEAVEAAPAEGEEGHIDKYQKYSMPFEFPEKPLACFCEDCQTISWQRYALADARLPHSRQIRLDWFREKYKSGLELDTDQLRIQHAPGHIFKSRAEWEEGDPSGKELLNVCRTCHDVHEHWAVSPCGHWQCYECMMRDRSHLMCTECQQDAPFVLITKYLMRSDCDEKDFHKDFRYTPESEEDEHSTKYLRQFGFVPNDSAKSFVIKDYPTRAYANYLRQVGIIVAPESLEVLRECMILRRLQCAHQPDACGYIAYSRDDLEAHMFRAHGDFLCESCQGLVWDECFAAPFEIIVKHQATAHGMGVAMRTVLKAWKQAPMLFYYWSPETIGFAPEAVIEDLFQLALGKLVKGVTGELTEEDIFPPDVEADAWDGWKSENGGENEEGQKTEGEEADNDKTRIEEIVDHGPGEMESGKTEGEGEAEDQRLDTDKATGVSSENNGAGKGDEDDCIDLL